MQKSNEAPLTRAQSEYLAYEAAFPDTRINALYGLCSFPEACDEDTLVCALRLLTENEQGLRLRIRCGADGVYRQYDTPGVFESPRTFTFPSVSQMQTWLEAQCQMPLPYLDAPLVRFTALRAEDERLRAKNSMLEHRESEFTRYKAAVESGGMVVIEHYWIAGTFIYDPAISQHIAGQYDDRGFWHILLSNLVTEDATVQKMRDLVQKTATTREQQGAQTVVRLKTPEGEYHRFRMNVKKKSNELGLAVKLYMTFIDLDADRAEA